MLTASISLMASESKKELNEKNAPAELAPVTLNSISGKVIDITTGEALAGVTVSIEGTDKVAFTDFDGNFRFSDVSQASAKISASFISYEKSLLNIIPSSNEVIVTMKSVY